jgi:hypothetical protein
MFGQRVMSGQRVMPGHGVMPGHDHGLKRDTGHQGRGWRPGRRSRTRSLGVCAAGLSLLLTAAGTASAASASPASHASAPSIAALPKIGIWTAVSAGMTTESPAPAFWVSPNGTGWDVFARQAGPNNFTYEAVQLNGLGKVTHGPADILAPHWGSLQFAPTLLGDGAGPVLVFDGIRGTTGPYSLGCVYGALPGKTSWTIAPWSLSADCHDPVPAAAENSSNGKVLAAAWPGGWAGGSGINYRIGVSPSIPAPPPDKHILLTKATALPTGMMNDESGNGHFYVAWAQIFSTPAGRDGIYVKDVTAGTPARKAPGTGTFSSETNFPVFGRVATVNRNTGGGVFIAYCANSPTCHLELWKVGAAKAIPVPSSSPAFGVSIAQGPLGRVWVTWYNPSSNRVFVARTNKADTRFGAVRSYATPCDGGGLLGLGGDPLPRLDIGMECVNKSAFKNEQFVTQVSAALTLGFPSPVHVGTSGATIQITVTDAGDPVPGALVTLDGKTATANTSGKATFKLPASIKAGKYPVTATRPFYQKATGTLVIIKK